VRGGFPPPVVDRVFLLQQAVVSPIPAWDTCNCESWYSNVFRLNLSHYNGSPGSVKHLGNSIWEIGGESPDHNFFMAGYV